MDQIPAGTFVVVAHLTKTYCHYIGAMCVKIRIAREYEETGSVSKTHQHHSHTSNRNCYHVCVVVGARNALPQQQNMNPPPATLTLGQLLSSNSASCNLIQCRTAAEIAPVVV